MGFLDKLLGREPRQQAPAPGAGGGSWSAPSSYAGQGSGQQFSQNTPNAQGGAGEDQRAVARYRYLLRTAPPETLEQVHAEAFSKLTPEQRQQLLAELSQDAPQGEAPSSAEPQDLARAATRAEMRQPGTLERTFQRGSFGGGGMGGTIMGSMMGTVAGVVIGSAIANSLFDGYDSSPEAAEAGDTGADAGSEAGGADSADSGDAGGDAGSSDSSGGDAGGDYGGGSDFGGGDFGGGGSDFGGGGDFGGF